MITPEQISEVVSKYQVFPVEHPDDAYAAYHIRYKRYCVDNNWETPQYFFEYDDEDMCSTSFLATKDNFKTAVGTCRMIPRGVNKYEQRFEISRFCTLRGEHKLLPIAMIGQLFKESFLCEHPNWVATLSPAFLRFLSGYGITFDTKGELVEKHGIRQEVASTSLFGMFLRIQKQRPDVFALMQHYM